MIGAVIVIRAVAVVPRRWRGVFPDNSSRDR